jgi:hypothetical protein
MKNIHYTLLGLLTIATVYSCKKSQGDFREFFEGKEIIYTGAVAAVKLQPGNLRMGLKWKGSTDPSITKYIVYYNNKADSQVVNVGNRPDSVSTIITGLSEYTYSFTIYSADANGNRSVPFEVNNAKVYGPVYKSSLVNRSYNSGNPYTVNPNGSVTLHFNTPDTINTNTRITYINQLGATVNLDIKGDESDITIQDYKSGSEILYNSSYIPVRSAIDTFTVSRSEKFPQIVGYAVCDKSLFRKLRLQHDIGPLEAATDLEKLWDGSVGAKEYPNIFHSDNLSTMPGTITIDLGKQYSLKQIEETGRICCHNPVEFEVWGIADITNAATTTVPNQAGWKEESIAKGWKLLKEIVRTDNGVAPMKFNLDGSDERVRYVRIRIKRNANGNLKETNLSELTFFYDVFNP